MKVEKPNAKRAWFLLCTSFYINSLPHVSGIVSKTTPEIPRSGISVYKDKCQTPLIRRTNAYLLCSKEDKFVQTSRTRKVCSLSVYLVVILFDLFFF